MNDHQSIEETKDSNKIKNQVISGMFWKFAERFIAQGVSFVVSVILARILMPEDYGAVAVVGIFINLANVFITSGLNVSLIQKQDADETDFSTIFWCNLLISVLLYIMLFLAAPLIASLYRIPELTIVIRVFAVSLPVSAFQAIQTAYVSKKMQFRKFFFATIIGTLISAVVGITMAYNGFGVWALVAQSLTNTVIDTIVLFFTVRWRPRFVFSKERALPLIRFGYKVMLTDMIATVLNNLVSFLMGAKYTSADLAYYTKGTQVPHLVRNNIFTTVISVLFPAMSNVSDDKEYVKKLARRAIGLLSYLIFPMMIGILAVNRTLVIALFTEKWLGMTPYIAITCAEAILSVSPTVGFQAIKSLGRSDILLKNEVITKPVYFLFVLIGMFISPLAMALGMLAASAYCCVVASAFVRKTVGYSLKEQLTDITRPLLLSGMMFVVVFLVGQIPCPAVIRLILQVLTGAACYLGLSLATKDQNYFVLKELAMKKIARR